LFAPAVRREQANRAANARQFRPAPTPAPAYSGTRAALCVPACIRSIAMKVDLKPFDFAQAVARAGLRPDGTPLAARRVEGAEPGSFQVAMTQALKAVSAQQFEAQRLQRELQLDNPQVSLEQTMIAMQRAQIGFQATLQVRNRLVQAYSEIMNMQV
jgi:flagellar hook-basal body complex protein FliE